MVMFTCQQLGVVGVCEVEALQRACNPGEILATTRVSCLQHSLGAGDLRDQHAPVPGQEHLATNKVTVANDYLLAVEVGAAVLV